jgi:hypothetical protein
LENMVEPNKRFHAQECYEIQTNMICGTGK